MQRYRSQAGWVRKALFRLHLWIGMGVGLYIVLISVSGSLIVFRRDYDRLLCPRTIMVSGPGRRLTDSQLLAKARAVYPEASVSHAQIRGARIPGAAIEIWIWSKSYRVERLFDPFTGTNLDDTVACEPRFVSALADLHDNLAGGRSGLLLNGIGALIVLLMCASGAVLWWPGKKRWRQALILHPGATGRRFVRDLHSVVGVWCLLLILLWTMTALYFAFPGPLNELSDALSAQGAATAASDALQDGLDWLVRAHFGRTFGPGIKVAWLILGLVPCALVITGVVMWWNRVVKRALKGAGVKQRLQGTGG